MYKILSLFVACAFSVGAWGYPGSGIALSNCTVTAIQPENGASQMVAEWISLNCNGTPISLVNSPYVSNYQNLGSGAALGAASLDVAGALNQGLAWSLMAHNVAMISFIKGFTVAVNYETDPSTGRLFMNKISMCQSTTTCSSSILQ